MSPQPRSQLAGQHLLFGRMQSATTYSQCIVSLDLSLYVPFLSGPDVQPHTGRGIYERVRKGQGGWRGEC